MHLWRTCRACSRRPRLSVDRTPQERDRIVREWWAQVGWRYQGQSINPLILLCDFSAYLAERDEKERQGP